MSWLSNLEVFFRKPRVRGFAAFAASLGFSASGVTLGRRRGSAGFVGALTLVAQAVVGGIRRGAALFAGALALVPGGQVRRGARAALASVTTFVARSIRRLASSLGFTGSTSLVAAGYTHPLEYEHLLITGQSLSVGGAAQPALSITPHPRNKMFVGGILAGLLDGGTGQIGDTTAELASLVPLAASDTDGPLSCGETVGPTVSATLFTTAARASLVSGHGWSGLPYAGIKKGTAYYALGLEQVTRGKQLLEAAGHPYKGVSAICVLHGEADQDINLSNYGDRLLEWCNDYNADIKAITGQTRDIPLIVYQTNWREGPGNASPPPSATGNGAATALEALRAHRLNPRKIVLAGPHYQFLQVDDIHFTNHSQRMAGLMYARAIKRVVVDGQTWHPVMPLEIARSGPYIDITFHVPTPPLVLDLERVLNPGWADSQAPYGFRYLDDSASAYAQSAELTGPATLRITLNTTPTGANKRVAYAFYRLPAANSKWKGPLTGARGCLRDSHAEPNPLGVESFNWCVMFYDPVP